MIFDPSSAVTSGSLLVFAGVVAATLRSHDKRIGDVERGRQEDRSAIAKLETAVQIKEGIRL